MEFEQEQEAAPVILAAPIYNAEHVRLGAFIGGPIVAGYFIAHNFKAFGDHGRANAAWIYAIVAAVVIFGGVFLIPEADKIPNYIIPIAYCWIAYYLTMHFMGDEITAHVNSGAPVFGWGRVVLIGFIGLAITLAALFVAVVIAADFIS